MTLSGLRLESVVGAAAGLSSYETFCGLPDFDFQLNDPPTPVGRRDRRLNWMGKIREAFGFCLVIFRYVMVY